VCGINAVEKVNSQIKGFILARVVSRMSALARVVLTLSGMIIILLGH
jgi:hypothetical protein